MQTNQYKRCSVCGARLAKASTADAHPKCLLPRVLRCYDAQKRETEMVSLVLAAASGAFSAKDAGQDAPKTGENPSK